MKKCVKYFLILLAIGAILGLVLAYFCKLNNEDWETDFEETEDDFELDEDLQAAQREYVPLNKASEEVA